ncbi:PREDICTED: ADP-ribosylation factor-binding protein GGA3 isoform X2 [Nanorana parkeri]|uniref:ADP-ribosylation factor-binding protein GGA3 isoform X2 n=1 Tax=Nanorana parkeri TaxID=125878 RepID=UPI000854FC5D|nr:PREDICTED: ADP-ribosylation factor-binding protein GGA3 isoform X2 [Nanorana parkeri]
MAESDGESLESWLNKATNPCNREEDWEYIISFCDQINKELEGPQIAVRLLAHKIQSPQEWEALQALTVLEACMKNCGRRFHSEVGKFRFLNELIKVVSPKYLGDRVSEKVKSKVVGLLYSWTIALPEEIKIKDAYQMLKRQGIVLSDPIIPVDHTLIPSPPIRPKNPIFDDEERSKLLARLLKSKNPDDLQEANKLIKSMVKEDEVRMQKVSKRVHTLEEVNNNVKLLQEMLTHYSKEESSEGDKELIKELFERCEAKRLTLFKMASDTEDNDTSLGDILQTSDNLSRAISLFKKIVEGQDINGEPELSETAHSKGMESSKNLPTLIDLGGFESSTPAVDSEPPPTAEQAFPALIPILPPPPIIPPHSHIRSSPVDQTLAQMSSASNSVCLLDEELLHLGLDDPSSNGAPELTSDSKCNMFQVDSQDIDFFTVPTLDPVITKAIPLLAQPANPIVALTFTSQSTPTTYPPLFNAAPVLSTAVPSPAPPAGGIVLHELEVLGQQLLQEAKGASAKTTGSSVALNAMPTFAVVKPLNPVATVTPPSPYCSVPVAPGNFIFPSHQQESPQKGSHISLANVIVLLETIKTSSFLPVTAYDKNGFRILLHFAKDCPPDRPDVLVVVISMLNTAPLPIQNIIFQAAVPKTMKVKLQPPSGTEMAAFNPILPPASITQVMLLANPLKEKVRLRYKLSFTLGEEFSTEVGEVDQFPSPDLWGKL